MAEQVLFTCLSCNMAFVSANEQRLHYKSDHHRYNMKRRVAGLPPVNASVFNEKVRERHQETDVVSSSDFTCSTCSKVYTTENSYKSHLLSKRHKNNFITAKLVPPSKPAQAPSCSERKLLDGELDQRIAAAQVQLSTSDCLFCPNTSPSLEENLAHMSLSHSFFIPDAEYLVDILGLIVYLGEKIAVGNVCIYCNVRSREFRTVEAVRKHMVDKGHCKIAYETDDDRLEISDFYDFTSSYPDKDQADPDKWEDIEDDGSEVDEIVRDGSDDDAIPDNRITYGDTEYELVLPSGTRIGHRSLKRHYSQPFRFDNRADERSDDLQSGVALVRRMLADKNSALVPRRGGYGAFGLGIEAVRARNPGEARNAGRHVREHRDQKRYEEFRTRVAFKHNHQKHFRDPLLQ